MHAHQHPPGSPFPFSVVSPHDSDDSFDAPEHNETPAEDTSGKCDAILVCATRPGARQLICDDVRKRDLDVSAVESPEAAIPLLMSGRYATCIIDDADSTNGVREVAQRIRNEGLATQLIALVPEGSEWGRDVLPAFLCDIIEKPYSASRIGSAIFAAIERAGLVTENRLLRQRVLNRNLQDIVGYSSAISSLRETIRVAADDDSNVLIRGEPGTGTNLVARGLHRCSRRTSAAFVSIDCSLHSAESLEQQVFGHPSETGDPANAQPGLLIQAEGGTLLLDNVEDMALPFQRKLSRVLESRQFVDAVTGQRRDLDVRIVAASHVDLNDLAARGQLREDLLHRLAGVTIQTPPLRIRRDDIPVLVEHFLHESSVREGRVPRRLSPEAVQTLQCYHWPGNVRELENIIERACTVGSSDELTAGELKAWLASDTDAATATTSLSLREMERKLIETTFTKCGGNRERTAQLLKIGLRTLSGKLREYGYPPRGGPGSNRSSVKRRAA